MSAPRYTPYVVAPAGSPDKFMLTEDTVFLWSRCPPKYWGMAKPVVELPTGRAFRLVNGDGTGTLAVKIRVPFYFSVSVAPNFPAARMASCVHDWLYANCETLACAWGCSAQGVRRLADHWFLAQMRSNGFALAVTYFLGVRVFGAAFNSIFGKSEKRAASTGEGQSDINKEDTP